LKRQVARLNQQLSEAMAAAKKKKNNTSLKVDEMSME
jgi:hypothetical protein